MLKKKSIISLIATVATVFALVGITLAYLIAKTGPVTATFAVGEINITLRETTGNSYQLVPGKQHTKDPRVTVQGGSEDCWLFVKLSLTTNFYDYVSYSVADGWTALDGHKGVYYRSVSRTEEDSTFYVLRDNAVTVNEGLTEEQIGKISVLPKLTVKAYAVQRYSLDTAEAAWQISMAQDRN